MSDQPAVSNRPRWWLRIGCVVVLTPILILAVLWFGGSPNVPRKPVRLVRGQDGQLQPEGPSDEGAGIWLEVQAGKLAANNTLSSASVETLYNEARFACRRVAILNRSDHPLLARAGAELLERMKPLGYIERLDYYPHGFQPEPGELAPDVFVTIELDKIAESGLLASRKVDTTILVSAGTSMYRSRCSYSDHLSPPMLESDWQATLHHRSTTTGIASSAAKHKQAAENIAEQIAKALTERFDKCREKYGSLPELPEVFYPPYRELPPMPLLQQYEVEQVCSHHGLMFHNETFWRLTTAKDRAEVLTDIQQIMETAGWTTSGISTEENSLPHLRMKRDGAVLEVFPRERRHGGVVVRRSTESSDPEAEVFYVRYLDPRPVAASSEECERGGDEVVDGEALMLFMSYLQGDQRDRVLEKLKTSTAGTTRQWLAIAKLHQRLKQDDEARNALLRANALLRTAYDQGDLSNQIRNLAKTLGIEEQIKQPIDAVLLQELGFAELKPGVQIADVEFGLNEPAHFFCHTSDGKLKTLSVQVVKNVTKEGKTAYQLAHVVAHGGSRSWGKGGSCDEQSPASHHTTFDTESSITVEVIKLPGKERFRLSVKFVGPRAV